MVEVQVTNPEEIKLRVTVELSIGQWEEILERANDTRYYAPLRDLMAGIKSGIDSIKDRARIVDNAAKP